MKTPVYCAMPRLRESAKTKADSVKALRIIVKQLSWLDGFILWQDGAVVYDLGGQKFIPEAQLISQSQRAIYKTREHWHVARQLLRAPESWRNQTQEKLEIAKQLRSLSAGELAGIADMAKRRDPAIVEKIAPYLMAEALCASELPFSPCHLLMSAGRHAEPLLFSMAKKSTLPHPVRALTLMNLGAIQRFERDLGRSKLSADMNGWLQRAYYWGLKYGLPPQPGIICRILADEEGLDIAKRYLFAREATSHFALSQDVIGQLCMRNVPVAKVVSIVESLAAIEPLADRLLDYRNELAVRSLEERRQDSKRLQRERDDFLKRLKELLHRYVLSTASPRAPLLFCSFVQAMRTLGPLRTSLKEAIFRALEDGLGLPPDLRVDYLDILVRHHLKIWSGRKKPFHLETKLKKVLDDAYERHCVPMLKLLKQLADPQLVGQAIAQDLIDLIGNQKWKSKEMCRLMLRMLGRFNDFRTLYGFRLLKNVIAAFPSADIAEKALEPVLKILSGQTEAMQSHYLYCAVCALPNCRSDLKASLVILPDLMRKLVAVTESDKADECPCTNLLESALMIARQSGSTEDKRIDWLFSYYESEPKFRKGFTRSFKLGVKLALALALEDREQFGRVASCLVHHNKGWDFDPMQEGIEALKQLPNLHSTMATLLPRQPLRCYRLITMIALARTFSPNSIAALQELHFTAGESEEKIIAALPPKWSDLLKLSPDLRSPIVNFVSTPMLDSSAEELPQAIERILSFREKRARELEYIRRLLEKNPQRADLRKRMQTLETMLQAEEPGEQSCINAVRVIRKYLDNAVTHARLKMMEEAMHAIYRGQLEKIAGPLPDNIKLDRYMLNAIQLTCDVEYNKRLLKRLIKAHVCGEHDWREQHPANVAFLNRIKENGVDVKEWLGTHPFRFPLQGIDGELVRLRLEKEPLKILEMGNYF
ncbi:MAG TPA: hypothetical protein V6D17_13190, partial [Candidatus Obscuribacterales bacterium]